MAHPRPAERRNCAYVGPAPTPPEPLLRNPAYLVTELMKLIRRESANAPSAGEPAERLPVPAALVLACVASDGPLSQRQVSERLRMDPADVVGLVDTLEERGYVERRRDPEDRRRYALDVTEDGRLFLGRCCEAGLRLNQRLFAPLSAEELHQFTDMIVRVLAHHDPRFADLGGAARSPRPDPV
ncbi:MarR family transcriptional regulator [Actinomadura rubrobrunea]|uniref:MarR family transcriptional regulator n=1 Tax=Actinomadura rubrobrunea TaxID=115335 RepID=A0A9W6UXH4_9ACTN|nr:MarR family winged helix-turn-helix transcriptional regulator [Actinomadura rubrobrunea]GLW67339.1 MarR family transcriptional regulator [Actinomadura rubrobrunea]